jgi:hypothetical protein
MAMGRKPKYTPETVDKIIEAMELGMTDGDAATIGGITTETFYQWKKNHSEFSDRATRARPKGWLSALAVIKYEAVKGRDFRAAAEFLDRTRSPYRKSQETVLAGPDGKALVIMLAERPDGPA